MDKDEFPITGSEDGMFGVEIHANIMGNLIHQDWIKKLSPEEEIRYFCYIILLVSIVCLLLQFKLALILGIVVFSTSLIACYFLFTLRNFWFPLALPLLTAIFLTTLGNLTLRYFQVATIVRRQEKFWDFKTEDDEKI